MGLPFQDALNNFLGYDPNDPSSAGFGGWPPRLPYQDAARRWSSGGLSGLAPGLSVPDGPFGLPFAESMLGFSGTGSPALSGAPATQQVNIPGEDVDHPDPIARYPDGTPILDRNGNPMQKPPFLDLGLALMRATDLREQPLLTERLPTLFSLLHQGGDWDYHRRSGTYLPEYRDVANYMVGAPAAAGVRSGSPILRA
jgi:hypothetical protein